MAPTAARKVQGKQAPVRVVVKQSLVLEVEERVLGNQAPVRVVVKQSLVLEVEERVQGKQVPVPVPAGGKQTLALEMEERVLGNQDTVPVPAEVDGRVRENPDLELARVDKLALAKVLRQDLVSISPIILHCPES